MGLYLRPDHLEPALDALAARPRTVVAGGTDFYPGRLGRPITGDVLDVSAIEELKGISQRDDHWRIGAITTWTEIAEHPLPPAFEALVQAAREVGGAQVQNAGTIGGNLCNASPAADGVPVLLALDARVELQGPAGVRVMPIGEFITAPRRTRRRVDELLTAVIVPAPAPGAATRFAKLGARRHLVISIVMAAVYLETDAQGTVSAARVAVGACTPVACRLPGLEAALIGRPVAAGLGQAVQPEHLAALAPVSDVRASADYRRAAAGVMLRRLLDGLGATA